MSLHEDLSQAGLSLMLMPTMTATDRGWWAILQPTQGKREKMPDALRSADAWGDTAQAALATFEQRIKRGGAWAQAILEALEASHPDDYL